MQLMQQYVQKSSSTFLPRRSRKVTGFSVFSHSAPEGKSGALTWPSNKGFFVGISFLSCCCCARGVLKLIKEDSAMTASAAAQPRTRRASMGVVDLSIFCDLDVWAF